MLDWVDSFDYNRTMLLPANSCFLCLKGKIRL